MDKCIHCGNIRSYHGLDGACQAEGYYGNYYALAEREGNLGEVIDRRVQVYGDVVESWTRIAQMWSALLDHEVSATDAAMCMIALKMVRASYAPDYADNSDDIEGYLDIFRKLVGDDMIKVRSVNEYIEAKWGES